MLGLILDHNGVVCDGRDFYKERSQRIANILNIRWSEDFMHFWKSVYIDASIGGITLNDYYKKISEKLKIKINSDADNLFISREKIIPEIEDTLKSIKNNKNVKIALLSNYVERWVDKFLEQHGIKKYFDAVVVSSSIKIRKPNPEAYIASAKQIGVPLQNCIYVGDSVADLDVCRKLGIRPVFIAGEETDNKGYEMLESVKDLIKFQKIKPKDI